MKKLLLFIFILICTNAFAQQKWYLNNEPTFSSSPQKIYFVDENEGWAIGSSGFLVHTSDGGKTWETQNPNYTGTLSYIKMFDKNNGIILGARRSFIKTTNGGKTWTRNIVTYLPDSTSDLEKGYFFNSQKGFVLAKRGTTGHYVLRTTNGGTTWDSVLVSENKTLLSISFGTENNGVIGGKDINTFYYTTDGGSTWTLGTGPSLPAVYTRSDMWGIYMVNATTAYATGWGSDAAGLQPTIYVKTTDGGKTWIYQQQAEENRSYFSHNSLYFSDANTGYAWGGSSSYYGGKIFKTTDGGTNWTFSGYFYPAEVLDVSITPKKVFILCNYGLLYSADNITSNTPTPLTKISVALQSITFPSANVGYVSSNTINSFLKTTDGGKTWVPKLFHYAPGTSPSIRTRTARVMQFFNDNTGIAFLRSRLVVKTTDGGETWERILQDTTVLTNYDNNDGFFFDQNTGYVVGRYGGSSPNYNYAIYKTTNGGSTWSQTTGAKELMSIHFGNTTNGVAVGKGGNILYTIDGGSTWTAATSPAPSQWNHVRFVTSTKVLAISDTGKLIVSTDAGKTWALHSQTPTTYSAYNFNKIYVKDAQNIYICGYRSKPVLRGTLIYSNDGGNTFTDLSDTTVFQNNLVDFTIDPAGNMWAISPSASAIYSTKQVTGISEISYNLPESYELMQNYPNPFNPTTTIEWKMNQKGKVEIKVFDVLGKEIKSLVNEIKDAGTYKVTWDGTNNNGKTVSTGIYYYMLKSNNFVDVKKMVLLK